MPLFIEFTPLNKIHEDSKEIDRLLLSVLRMSSLPHQGCEIELRSDADRNLELIKIKIKGILVIDEKSANMLFSIIAERLNEDDLPFYVSKISRHSADITGEAIFQHERFKPIKSRNALDLTKINNLEVPAEFCCHS